MANPSAALLAHIVSQTQENINFLAQNDYISAGDASAILSRLPGANPMAHVQPDRAVPARVVPPPTKRPKTPPPPPVPAVIQARALWDYKNVR